MPSLHPARRSRRRRLARRRSPAPPVEELLAGIWEEVLGRGRVGAGESFLDLGGDSLLAARIQALCRGGQARRPGAEPLRPVVLAIRVLARLRAATGVDLPLRAIFANPTVATLAAEIERSLRDPGTPPLPPVEPAGTGPEAPAAPAQERLWYFHQLDRSGSVLNVPHPLRLSGPLRPAVLARSLTEIARRHSALRTTFVNSPEGLRQRIAPPSDVALPLAALSVLPPERRGDEARRLTEAEAREPFDLSAGPLWRARLVRLDEEEHRLLLDFHHIIVDGWSLEILERELAALYPAFSQGLPSVFPSPGPEPALQYADFAVWQRRQLGDQRLALQLDYWRRQLAGVPPVLDLPADRPRPPRPTFRGAARYLPLPPEVAAQTRELGRREGSTLFMTTLAAFAALLGRYTGRTDVVVGSPAANRHTPGTEGLFGFFVGILPFRLDLGDDPTFRELLRRSRETALGAYAHPDVPFERLVEELDLAGDKSRTPLVQVMLSVQNGSGGPFRFADLTAEPVEAHSATSQFDFTLGVVDLPDGLTLEAEYSTDCSTARPSSGCSSTSPGCSARWWPTRRSASPRCRPRSDRSRRRHQHRRSAVAFELARQLAADKREVALLAIIDSTPGPWPRPAAAEVEADSRDDGDDTPWLLEIATYLEHLWDLDLGLTAEILRGLSPEAQALRLLDGLKHTPFGAKAGPDSLRRLLTVFKTNVRAFRRYRPAPYPGKITLFLPAENTGALEEDVPDDPTHGWGELSPLPVASRPSPATTSAPSPSRTCGAWPNGCAAASRRPVRREVPPAEAAPTDPEVRRWPSSWPL